MSKRNYNKTTNLSSSADVMIGRIVDFVDDRIKKTAIRVVGATVTKINTDGTVNVKLPTEESVEFTYIQNQTPFKLSVGDAVELILKNGTFSNCWILAKHGMGERIMEEAVATESEDEEETTTTTTTVITTDTRVTTLSNKDVDNLTNTANYIVSSGNTNLPDESEGSVLQVVGNGTYAFQTIVVYSTNTLYHRAYKDATWTSWAS